MDNRQIPPSNNNETTRFSRRSTCFLPWIMSRVDKSCTEIPIKLKPQKINFPFLHFPPFPASAPRVICLHGPLLWACLWRPNPLLEKQPTEPQPDPWLRQPHPSPNSCQPRLLWLSSTVRPGLGGKQPFKIFAPPFSRTEASEASSMLLAVVTRKDSALNAHHPPEKQKKTPFSPSFSPRHSKTASRMTVHFSCGTPQLSPGLITDEELLKH